LNFRSLHIFFTTYLQLIALSALCQSTSLINYSIKEGLPSNEVYDVFQDKEGFIWFATDNGVVRFDGEEMKNYHTKDGLSDPVIFGFHEDPSGKLWFRSFSGKICYYDYVTKQLIQYKYNDVLQKFVGLGGGLLSSLYVNGESIWISTNSKTAHIDSLGKIKIKSLSAKTLNIDEVNGEFLIGFNPIDQTINDVVINGKAFPLSLTKTPLANHVVSVIRINETIYFSLVSDVFKYENGEVSKVYGSTIPIINISKDDEDTIWIGFINNGSGRLHTTTGKFESNDYLKDKSITKTFQDREGHFWISTLENGVYCQPDRNIKIFPPVSSSKIKGVAYYNNNIIVADQQGIIHFLTDHHLMDLKSPILSLFQDMRNRLWVSTNSDIYILNSNYQIEKKIAHTTKIGFGTDNKFIWGAGALSGKFSFDGDKLETYRTGVYRSILVRDSLILLSGRLGFEIRNKNFELLGKPKELESYKIIGILNLGKDTDLLSTIGDGFILLKNLKVIKIFNSQNNFIADNIYSTTKKDSLLWLGTEKGLIRINILSLLKDNASINQISKKNGLLENKVNFVAASDKDIWAFSENGISQIPLNKNQIVKSMPKFYLKSFLINNKEKDIISGGRLDYDQNNLTMNYGFLSFSAPEIFVRFRLSADKSWTYTQDRILRFFSLSPGSYCIQIEYSSDNYNWIPAFKPINFAITPPWWKIWYIQLSIAAFLLIGVFIYFKLQLKYLKQNEAYLNTLANHQQDLIRLEFESIEKERNRIAHDLHDGVGTSLLTLKMMVGHSVREQKTKELIDERFQETFTELKNIILDLSPPGLDRYGFLAGIQVYMDKIKHTLPVKIELYTFGEEINDKKVSPLLFRIIQELLSNSIKHSKASLIKIQINSFKDLVNIIFEDNGQGFQDVTGNGMGLGSIQFRVESLNGSYDLQSSSRGSSFIIDIPLSRL
jgi:signal transduction histidine kinase/ligand-binding sensor domain-containing protein